MFHLLQIQILILQYMLSLENIYAFDYIFRLYLLNSEIHRYNKFTFRIIQIKVYQHSNVDA